jgi:hypothetical protein
VSSSEKTRGQGERQEGRAQLVSRRQARVLARGCHSLRSHGRGLCARAGGLQLRERSLYRELLRLHCSCASCACAHVSGASLDIRQYKSKQEG